MLGFINYCVTGKEAIELNVSIIFPNKENLHLNTFGQNMTWSALFFSCTNHPIAASVNFLYVSQYRLKNSFSSPLTFRHITWEKYNTVFKQNFYKVVQFWTGIRIPLSYVILLFQVYDRLWYWSVYFWISDFIETDCLTVFLSVELDHCPQSGCCVALPEYVSYLLFLWLFYKYCLSNNLTLFTSILE